MSVDFFQSVGTHPNREPWKTVHLQISPRLNDMNSTWIYSFVTLLFLSLSTPMPTCQEGWQAGGGYLPSPQFPSSRLWKPWYLWAVRGWKWDTWLRRNRAGTLWLLLTASASGCTLDAGAEEMAFKWWQIIRHMIKMRPTNLKCSDLLPSLIWGCSCIL